MACLQLLKAGNPEVSFSLSAVLTSLKTCLADLLINPSCSLCNPRTAVKAHDVDLCQACRARLGLPNQPLGGTTPLPWKAVGWYEGELRRMILHLRERSDTAQVRSICSSLRKELPSHSLLVPIPGWKAAKRSNPLPQRLCSCLERESLQLLSRCRKTVGQHRLTLRQRFINQRGSFRLCRESRRTPIDQLATSRPQPSVWLVDDIITSGATVLAARDVLAGAGLGVEGVVCLARTPRNPHPCDLGFIRCVDNAPG